MEGRSIQRRSTSSRVIIHESVTSSSKYSLLDKRRCRSLRFARAFSDSDRSAINGFALSEAAARQSSPKRALRFTSRLGSKGRSLRVTAPHRAACLGGSRSDLRYDAETTNRLFSSRAGGRLMVEPVVGQCVHRTLRGHGWGVRDRRWPR